MLLGALTARFAHGLLIIAAPESGDPHDDWDPVSEPVHAGPDSLYVGVLPAASGLVNVECFEGSDHPSDFVQMYSGQLSLAGSKFLIYDPNGTVLLTVLTDSDRVNLALFGNELDDPSQLKVFVTAA